jgi:hypothetical protein
MAPGVALQNASSGTPDQVASGLQEQPAALKDESVGTVWASTTLVAARRTAMNCIIGRGGYGMNTGYHHDHPAAFYTLG